MPKTVTLRIDEKMLDRFKRHAEMENRSISNFIETATLRYVERKELLDDLEMSELMNNEKLRKKLKKGSEHAQKKEGVLSEYRILEANQFLCNLEGIGSNIGKKIYNKIQNYAYQQLRTNPFYGKNIKKLIDYAPPTWRYRIGDYRLFYEIDEHESIVYIIAIDIRSRAY